jgi:hypothetical protein
MMRLHQREERPREEVLREYWNFSEGCVHSRPDSTVYSVLWPVAVQNTLCRLACFVHHHLHLSFKSSPASFGWRRTGPPV